MNRTGMGRRPTKSNKKKDALKQKSTVLAVRRLINPSDYGMMGEVAKTLTPELGGAGRLFTVDTLSATVIQHSRFTKNHRTNGPATSEVIAPIDSCHNPIEARLGRLGVYGSGRKHKLAFELISSDIIQEAEACEAAFAAHGVPLLPNPNAVDGITPHCSIAQLNEDWVEHYREPVVLARLNEQVKVLGKALHFLPVPPQK